MSIHHATSPSSGLNITAVASLRARLWDAGFRPVAVYNSDSDHPSAGKAPKGKEWQNRARQNPPDAADAPPDADALNTGILCDGLRAIDIDVDDTNLASQIKLAALNRFGETSVRYRSNSGRTLLVYRAKEGEPVKRVIVGNFGKVEVLGKGQQFVAFGRHPSGADLQWLYDPPGEICLDQIPQVTEEDISQLLSFAAPIIEAQPENFRQGTGAVSNHGLQAADALQVVAAVCAIPNDGPADWEGWNRIGMAIWAATSGSEAGRSIFIGWSQQHPAYDESETVARWDHYRTSPPSRIGAGTLFHMAKRATREPDDSQLEDVPPPLSDEDYNRGEAPREETEATDAAAKPPLEVLYFEDIQPRLSADDFVEGLLISSAMSVVYGQSNSGKTFFCSDLALHVAAGMPWNGREIEQGAVLWLAMEGAHGISNRVSAWASHHGVERSKVLLAVVPVALNLLDPEADTGSLIQTIKIVAARLGMPIVLTVVDTLSRAIAGGNENSPEDMGALVTNGTAIQQITKSHVMWIHHSGKDEAKGARGHSLLRAASDTEIEITSDGTTRTARVTKQREMECSGEFTFTLKVHELGMNKRGKPVTSCVVVHSDAGDACSAMGPGSHTSVAKHLTRLRGHTKRAFEVLIDLMAERGKSGQPGAPSGAMSVPDKWWRDRFMERGMPGTDNYDAKQKGFKRAATDLINSHIVGFDQGRVWIVGASNSSAQTGDE